MQVVGSQRFYESLREHLPDKSLNYCLLLSCHYQHVLCLSSWSMLPYNVGNVQVRNNEPINIWKSRYSNLYYGCSRRSVNFRC